MHTPCPRPAYHLFCQPPIFLASAFQSFVPALAPLQPALALSSKMQLQACVEDKACMRILAVPFLAGRQIAHTGRTGRKPALAVYIITSLCSCPSLSLQVFASLWDGAPPDLQAKLAKTATTWKELPSVPSGTMSLIQAKMQPPQQSLLFNGNLRAGMQQYSGPGSAMQPIMLAPAAPAMQHPGMFAPQPLVTYQQLPQQMQYMQQQAFSASNPLLAAAAAAASTGGSNLAAHLLNLGQKLVGQLPTAQGAGGGTANQVSRQTHGRIGQLLGQAFCQLSGLVYGVL